MSDGFYLAIVLVVAFLAIVAGFRRGITRQIASVLALAFGVVAARILGAEFTDSFLWARSFSPEPEYHEVTVDLVCCSVIYAAVFLAFSMLSGILSGAMSVFQVGMFNRLLGAFFSLLKNLMWLSIIFNLLLCYRPDCGLLRFEASNDGNLVAAVMDLSPALLGCYGAEDFAHFHQLKEAKFISCNFKSSSNVIFTDNLMVA